MTVSAIKSPFKDPEIAFAVRIGAPLSVSDLEPAEVTLLESMTSKHRRAQFSSGRAAAHEALSAAGLNDPLPILQGQRGEPLWPAGWIGSIAHTSEVAVAAASVAGRRDGLRGVGIDIEIALRSIRPDLGRRICTENELRRLPQPEAERGFELIRIFSAKEAVYKAVYPLLNRFLEFREVEIEQFDQAGCAAAHLNYFGAPGGFSIEVSAIRTSSYVVTGAVVYSG